MIYGGPKICSSWIELHDVCEKRPTIARVVPYMSIDPDIQCSNEWLVALGNHRIGEAIFTFWVKLL
jgi:hypothetical protein